MGLRPLAVALCGTVVLAGWLAPEFAGFGSPAVDFGDSAMVEKNPASPGVTGAEQVDALKQSAIHEEIVPVGAKISDLHAVATATSGEDTTSFALASVEPVATERTTMPLPELPARSMAPPAEAPRLQVATVNPADLVQEKPATLVQRPADCGTDESCIDGYLWSLYERAPKIDTIKVPQKIKVTVKKKGKTRTVTKTVTKFEDENFAWKDPKAAERFGIPLARYVIGGMDKTFKMRLYRMLRAMDDAGLEPAISSAFRDDYRQALARGNKAADNRSYHGGSLRGGYGHGLAADLVSVKGATRMERWRSSDVLWKWVDANGKQFGIGRPYLDRDPPHVGPIDGEEYLRKRGNGKTQVARLKTKKAVRPAVQPGPAIKGPRTAKSSKARTS